MNGKRRILPILCVLITAAGCAQAPPPTEPAFSAAVEPAAAAAEASAPTAPDDDAAVGNEIADAGTAEGYAFVYNGQTIHVGIPAEPVVEQLGEPLNYFEAPSCAFQGIDKTYFYSGIELHTFPLDERDYVLAVQFADDSVETPEGVYLGMPAEDALDALGDGYEQNGGMHTYTMGHGTLEVMIEDGTVVDVAYRYVVGEESGGE